MHLVSRSLFGAVAALLFSTAVSADQIGGGNHHCNANYYQGSVTYLNGTNYSIHPTFVGCQTGLNAMPIGWISFSPCQLVICRHLTAEEIGPGPTWPQRLQQTRREEDALRARYAIDAYELELQALWHAPDERDDGGH